MSDHLPVWGTLEQPAAKPVAKFPKSGELAADSERWDCGDQGVHRKDLNELARIMGECLSQEDLAREMCMTANTFTSRNGNY